MGLGGDVAPELGSDAPVPAAPDFSCATQRENGRAVVSVRGDIDIASAPILYAALQDAAAAATESIVADFTDVTFIDSSGVQCLLAAQRDVVRDGTTFVVQRPRPNVALVFELLGLTEQLVVEGGP
jgi:anti-sigma B factor antagonist